MLGTIINDTIAAVATAPGPGAIAIVRLSGPKSLALADQLIAPPAPLPSSLAPHSFIIARLRDPADPKTIIDQAVILVFHAPRSYTGEDLVEFQIHGGAIPSQRLLRVLCELGARPAQPGEFTLRAFLNGKLDLTQAEGVADLIHAHSSRSAQMAIEQISGSLSNYISIIYNTIMTASSDMENSLDFSDEDFPAEIFDRSFSYIADATSKIDDLLKDWNNSRIIREGFLVVITGSPNVGKSTLLNKLLGFDRAIVTEIPGTTRDVIEEGLSLDGYQIRLADTAGIRDTDCKIEQLGINRARSLLEKADLIIKMVDASNPDDFPPSSAANMDNLAKKSILFANKTDLANIDYSMELSTYSQNIIMGSLLNDQGLNELKQKILDHLKQQAGSSHSFIISERHRKILVDARSELQAGHNLIQMRATEMIVLASNHLRNALENLGTITGRTYTEELLTSIFSRFCVGK
jgi:tRNA modification GTPase